MIIDSTEPPMTQNHCYTQPFSEVYNEDCIEVMKRYEDNYFDVAIVDPPYGIDINSSGTHFKEKYEIKNWDKETPTDEYFLELKRVSKNQII